VTPITTSDPGIPIDADGVIDGSADVVWAGRSWCVELMPYLDGNVAYDRLSKLMPR
jgi:hypothetical protein